jgi:DNA-binding LacI/PurR family transcriptional regulator
LWALTIQSENETIAIEHLLNLGHQQIAFVTGPPLWSASKERRKGWAKALKHVGLELGPCIEGDWSAESGFAAAVKLLDRPNTALIGTSVRKIN